MTIEQLQEIQELAVFKLDGDLYGMDIGCIQEINKNLTFTEVHGAGDEVRGVMNLRGQIVTVIDLREQLRYPPREVDSGNRVIVVRYGVESVGLLVDRVEDIMSVDPRRLEFSKARISGVSESFFSGVYKDAGELIVIVDVDQVLSEGEQTKVAAQ